ncbi:MAG: phosphatase PAP2 family protein, partial [Smithellaceae bacterium]|nr:phosphatase PAP2 family protein [Smithellaceae bacterium]
MSLIVKLAIFFRADRRPLGDFCLPVLILLAASSLIALTDADLFISGLFYDPQLGWHLADNNPWQFTYDYGMIPAFIMALGGFGLVLFSLFYEKIRHCRKIGIFLVLFLLIGPGLVVNIVFKDHWGRPRPAEIENFGGTAAYQPFWQPGEAGEGKSFPSGHASVGFFILAPFFFLRRNYRRLAFLFL